MAMNRPPLSPTPLHVREASDPAFGSAFLNTAPHLRGLDHEKVSFYNSGIQRRLTDVHGRVIKDVLA